MPRKGKGKKQRRLRPFEKVQAFVTKYAELAKLYDVPTLDSISELYDPIIETRGKRIPPLVQFAEDEVPAHHIRPLIEAYKASPIPLRFLSFLSTGSGDDGLHVLAHALEPPMEIAGIAYHSNEVTESGCRAIARAFVINKSLAILELDFNPTMGDAGAIGLCHYGHSQSMNKLSLRFCDIGDEGAKAIGRWIARDDCILKELILTGNQIGPAGAIAIAEGLKQNKSLVRIDLNDNSFGYDRAALEALHDGIQANPTLEGALLLNHFECPEGMGEKFLELVQSKPLGEFVLTVKMDSILFQNIKAIALVNKRKLAKAARRKRIATARSARESARAARESARSIGAASTTSASQSPAAIGSSKDLPGSPSNSSIAAAPAPVAASPIAPSAA